MNNTYDQNALSYHPICAKTIIMGSLLTLALTSSFHLLGIGLGLTSINFTDPSNIGTISTGSYLWMLIISVISIFVGSWIVTYLYAKPYPKNYAYISGALVWTITTILVAIITISGASIVINGSATVLNKVLTSVNSIQSDLNINNFLKKQIPAMQNNFHTELNKMGVHVDEQTITNNMPQLRKYLLSQDTQDKEDLKNELIANLNKNNLYSHDQIENSITSWENYYVSTIQTLQNQINKLSNTIAKNLLILFFINILSLGAALCGSAMGARVQTK